MTRKPLWITACAITLACSLAFGAMSQAQGNDEGIIAFTPSAERLQPLDTIALDIILDFSVIPALRGGLSVSWDPAVFDFVSWDASSSTIGGDPAFLNPPVLNAPAGTLSDATVGNFVTPLLTPGVMATVTLRARAGASTCESSVRLLPSTANPWIDAVSANFLVPSYRRARIAVGNSVCTSPPLTDDVADMSGRCIGILPQSPLNGASCPNPVPADWTVSPLFDDLTIDPSVGITQPLSDHMARYCVYESTNIVGPPIGPDCRTLAVDLERVLPNMTLQPASMAAAVQAGGDSLDSMLKEPLQNQFLDQAGFVSIPLAQAGDGVVDLMIIDTMEFGFSRAQAVSPQPSHGYALRRFSQSLVSGMEVDEQSLIALPFKCFNEDTCIELCGNANGCADAAGTATGYLGTPESVARAIHNSVAEWSAALRRSRLVINASVGWRPQFNFLDGQPRAGYLAFLDSLKEASCVGALVIASAGNDNSGPDQPGGLLSPATAGVLAAPTLSECQALGYAPPAADFVGPRALLYPVAAVDAADQRLLTRPLGEPPLVAFGDHATLLGPSFTGGTHPTLTGSSVASLIVSAAAASAWTADDGLAPAKVMEIVRGAGQALGRDAEVCLPDWPCNSEVRRVSVCSTYRSACEMAGLPDCPICPDALPIQLDLDDNELDELEAAFDNPATRTISFAGYQQNNVADFTPCNGPNPYRYYQSPTAADPLNPCPQDQFYSTLETPWATGQPEHQSCPNCTMTERSPGKLFIEIQNDFGSEFKDPTLYDATLLCRNRTTGHVNAFRLPDTDPNDPTSRGYSPGDRLFITDIDNDLCPGDDIRLAFSADALDADNVLAPASLVQKLLVIRHDEDDDDVPDFRDNCILSPDPAQRDTDNDGIGNACDADIARPNDCLVNVLDLGVFKAAFFATPASPNWNPDADFTGDLKVNAQDLGVLRAAFFGTPGPSAQDNACAD